MLHSWVCIGGGRQAPARLCARISEQLECTFVSQLGLLQGNSPCDTTGAPHARRLPRARETNGVVNSCGNSGEEGGLGNSHGFIIWDASIGGIRRLGLQTLQH